MNCNFSGSPVHGVLQARILEWVAIPFPRDLPNSGIEPGSLALQADSVQFEHQGSHFGAFPGGSGDKELACQWRRHKRCGFNPRVRKILWRRAGKLIPVFSPGKFHGQRSLVSYSPWGHKESDMTEQLSRRAKLNKVIRVGPYSNKTAALWKKSGGDFALALCLVGHREKEAVC